MDFTTIKNNLEQRGYAVSCFPTAKAAADYLCAAIQGKTVGFGGSVTLQQMDILSRLSGKNQIFSHWSGSEGDMLAKAQQAQIYLSSVNGISEKGEIINIDGRCNRVSAMLYGHEKVYFVVGRNKIAPDYDAALYRARNIAAPKNAQRLGRATPCAKNADRCYDCNSPQRICRALSVLWEKPTGMDYEVVLIDQELGY